MRTRSFPANHEFHSFYEKLLLFPLTDLFPLPRETLRTNDWFNRWFLPKNNDILIDIIKRVRISYQIKKFENLLKQW